VRHPLYAAEEIALIGVAMHAAWYAAVPFLAVHLALQLKRMNYEEQLLGEVFPRYAAYARRTARWVPGVW
jgi:protein-S-isoprenylcysteine O-methyltransferase Ste14